MTLRTLVLLGLAALPAAAGQPWQVGLGLNYNGTSKVMYSDANLNEFFKRGSKAAVSLFAGRQVRSFGASELSVTGEYQFNTSYPSSTRTERGSLWSKSYAPGVQWTWHGLADAGLGLQYRFVRLEGGNLSTSNNRAWVNATVGQTVFNDSGPSPFVNLRAAVALGRTAAPPSADVAAGDPGALKTLLKAMDGDFEVSIQFGLRF